ncbi:hypothetical protein [Clostridium sp. HBUAS56010]|uniref:hypothetical protein n=1 Tax=Clostridium sp. HBUAS56010 TaxID=2571127 RepID=UPI001177BCCA|nr:hypothetical protein [Clostridium sp. HBUAS56010]
MLPYIRSNASFYNRIAEEYFTTIAQAKTREEYEKVLFSFCKRWQRELTDENVLSYFIESGEMEPNTADEFRQFYIENAEPFQKAIINAKLTIGNKYTLVYMNEFGFPVADKIVFKGASPCQYAQYTDAVRITARRARKRSDVYINFYDCSLAIYEGWNDLPEEVTHERISDNLRQSKYSCFDARFFEDCVKYFGKPIVEYRNFKTRESDGKVFA